MTSHSRAERAADARPPESPAIGKPTLCMINYNGERFLRDSLRSAVAQADRFVEILLIDDASQDGSLQMVGARVSDGADHPAAGEPRTSGRPQRGAA